MPLEALSEDSSEDSSRVSAMFFAPGYGLLVMFTLYRVAFTPASKPYRIELLFTYKNGDFGAISVTERSGAMAIFKVERVTCGLGVHTIAGSQKRARLRAASLFLQI